MKDKQDYVLVRIFLDMEYFRIYMEKIAIICFLLSHIIFKSKVQLRWIASSEKA